MERRRVNVWAGYLACGVFVAVLSLPGVAGAQTCEQAEATLKVMFDDLHTQSNRFSGDQFVALSENEKLFWTASLLDAQIRRLDAILKAPADVPEDKMKTAVSVFLALDAAVPCYEFSATSQAASRDFPDKTGRVRLRSEIEALK